MAKYKNAVISAFAFVFVLLFVWISWLGATEPYFPGIRAGEVSFIAFVILTVTFGLSFAGRNAAKRVSEKAESFLLVLFFCVYLGCQVYVASEMYSRPGTGWDFNIVAGHAMSYGNFTGTNAEFVAKVLGKDGQWYYSAWPNNAPLYVLLAYFFRLLSPLGFDLNFVGIGLNIFCIDLALLLLYCSVKKATGSLTASWISLLLACLHGALLIYVPIYYTDTLTLPCTIGTFYLIQNARTAASRKSEFFLYAAAAAVCAFGSVLKFSVVILLIAEIITELLTEPIRKSIKRILLLLAVFLVLYFALQYACTNAPIVVIDKEIAYVPKLHWVMMGLSGNGDYNAADYQLTISVPTEQRDAFVRRMILQRVKDYGFSGMMNHLHEKIAFVWGEGTYFSSVKIDRCRAKASWLDTFVNYLGKQFLPYATFSEGLMVFTELMLALSGAYLLIKQIKEPDMVFAETAVFGLFLFECLWEARSRYLFDYLPIFLFISAFSAYKVIADTKRRSH